MKISELLLESQLNWNWAKLLVLMNEFVLDYVKKHNSNIPRVKGPGGADLAVRDVLFNTDETHPIGYEKELARAVDRLDSAHQVYDAIEETIAEIGGNLYDFYVNASSDDERLVKKNKVIKLKVPEAHDVKIEDIKQMIWKLSPDIHHYLRKLEQEETKRRKEGVSKFDADQKAEADDVSAEDRQRFVDYIKKNFESELVDSIKWLTKDRERDEKAGRKWDHKQWRFTAWMTASAANSLSKPKDFAPFFKKIKPKDLKNELRNAFLESSKIQKDEKLRELCLNQHFWDAMWPEIESFVNNWIKANA